MKCQQKSVQKESTIEKNKTKTLYNEPSRLALQRVEPMDNTAA